MSPAVDRQLRPRLPEDETHLRAFEDALHSHAQDAVDAVERVRETLATKDLLLLENPGVPLRPLFLSRTRLQQVCSALHRNTLALMQHLSERQTDLEALAEDLPIPSTFWTSVDAVGAFSHRDAGLVMRPDGFLFEDRFLMTEPNAANGYLISATYPDAVHAVFTASPAFKALGWDATTCVQRPLQHIRRMLKERAPAGVARPRLALFWRSEERDIIKDWNERTQAILRYVERVLREEDGWDVVFATEQDLQVDAQGTARLAADGGRVDVVFQIPIGTFFLQEPERLRQDLAHLASTHVGQAPFIQPVAHVGVDKGTMPLWGKLPCWPVKEADGFETRMVDTHYPQPERAQEYRLHKDAWLLKRSFEGKDTHAGISTHGRLWNRTLATALSTAEYVMQPYVTMSVARIPVVVDRRVEWVDCSVELSLFVVDGQFSGAFARFLPAADGVVLSPPPPGMGFTLVMDV